MSMHFVELGVLMVIVLLISIGVVLWMKSQKQKPNPMLQLLVLVLLLVLGFAGMKWGGETMGIFASSDGEKNSDNPYRQALLLLQEPYPAYTSANNLASTNRESLTSRFHQMEKLKLAELTPQVRTLLTMIESAPATGQTGIYNMRMTSEIQARWEDLRRELQKRAERSN